MNVLLMSENKYFEEEMQEFFQTENATTFFADSPETTIQILNSFNIEVVILNFDSLSETELLKHINKYHRDTIILLLADIFLYNVISIFREGNFMLLKNPFKMQDLKEMIKK